MVRRRDTALADRRAPVRLNRHRTLARGLAHPPNPWREAWRVQRVGIDSEYDSGEAMKELMSMLVAGAAMAVLLVLGIAAQTFVETFDHR